MRLACLLEGSDRVCPLLPHSIPRAQLQAKDPSLSVGSESDAACTLPLAFDLMKVYVKRRQSEGPSNHVATDSQ